MEHKKISYTLDMLNLNLKREFDAYCSHPLTNESVDQKSYLGSPGWGGFFVGIKK